MRRYITNFVTFHRDARYIGNTWLLSIPEPIFTNQEADDGGNIGISLNPDMLVNGFCQLGRMVDLRWDIWSQVLGRYEQGMDNV